MSCIIGISGWSGSGKTQLITKLIKYYKDNHKLKVCVIKHAHSSFKLDKEGKDSFRFYDSGADQVVISSSKQWAIISRVKDEEMTLKELLKYSKKDTDITLVEGWKFSNIKKIEVYREILKKPLLYKDDNSFIAIATDYKNISINKSIQTLNLNNIEEIGVFILNYCKNKNA